MKLTVALAAVTTGAVASTYIGYIPALLLMFFSFPRVHSSDKEEISEKESNVVSQLTFAIVLIGPYLVARCFGFTADLDASAASWLEASSLHAHEWLRNPAFIAASLALFPERLFYSYVWVFNRHYLSVWKASPFLQSLGPSPVDAVYKTFYLFKLIQFVTMGWFLSTIASEPRSSFLDWAKYICTLNFAATTPAQFAAGLHLILVGQSLNSATYQAIGKNGVYYGSRLGEKVPWATGYPFNTFFAHPQYVGAMFTVLGAAILAATDSAAVNGGLFGLVAVQGFWYLVMAGVEEFL